MELFLLVLNIINNNPLMRRKSTDLFTEAKKRFQFKPVSSRKQHLQDIMGRRTPECSNVRDKEKEN
jgi:hypothetical protein